MIGLSDLIAQFEADLLAQYGARMLPSHRQALSALKACRSRFAPQMLAACTGCQTRKVLPHSCGHRARSHCQHYDSEVWLQRQLKALLPATYFLVSFTLPAQLGHLAWSHQRFFGQGVCSQTPSGAGGGGFNPTGRLARAVGGGLKGSGRRAGGTEVSGALLVSRGGRRV